MVRKLRRVKQRAFDRTVLVGIFSLRLQMHRNKQAEGSETGFMHMEFSQEQAVHVHIT